ncbi:hypothetical protein [Lamprobacter modestohalophilus]|nr:hypothetical protein [Lamprobacter modestohalophilus]
MNITESATRRKNAGVNGDGDGDGDGIKLSAVVAAPCNRRHS